MADPWKKGETWYGRVKDRTGKWLKPAIGKLGSDGRPMREAEARRINNEWQLREDRYRMGLEQPPAVNAHATFAELVTWFVDHRMKSAEQAGAGRTARKHLVGGALGQLAPAAVTPGKVEAFLYDLEAQLAPGTLNNIRKMVSRAFNAARKSELFFGPSPITKDVKVRVVPEKVVQFYEAEWVLPMLEAVAPQHLNLVAVAFLQGLRKGELFALEKTDVDWARAQLIIRRSHQAATTKGKKEKRIPIHPEAVPHLLAAIERSPCPLVFVQPNGKPYRKDAKLSQILRTAMRRALVGVTHYVHKCRRKGCNTVEQSADGALRRCGTCGMKLWVTPEVPKLRFHDTRHTTASLLAMSGAAAQAIQRYLRHSNLQQTEKYMHLSPGFLRADVERLSFGLPRASAGALPPIDEGPEAEAPPLLAAGGTVGFATPLPPAEVSGLRGPLVWSGKPEGYPTVMMVGATGFEPATPSPPVPGLGIKGADSGSHACVNTAKGSGTGVRPSRALAPLHSGFATPLPPDAILPARVSSARPRLEPVPSGPLLLGVKEVAKRLGLCTATVYKLCDSGQLRHVRLGVGRGGNAVRVAPADLAAFVASRARGGR